jgi:hypothetical protein
MSARYRLELNPPDVVPRLRRHRITDTATGCSVLVEAFMHDPDTPAHLRGRETEIEMIRSLVRRANKAT